MKNTDISKTPFQRMFSVMAACMPEDIFLRSLYYCNRNYSSGRRYNNEKQYQSIRSGSEKSKIKHLKNLFGLRFVFKKEYISLACHLTER